MRLLIISDTHGDISKVCKVVNDIKDLIDGIIHLGDIVEDADKLRKLYSKIPVYNICGNCDYGTNVPPMNILDFEGKKIFITHGHLFSVYYDTTKLVYKAMELGADVALFGHTHIPYLEQIHNVYAMNPGSLTQPRGGSKPSYGIIKIENGVITSSLVEYKED